MVLGRRLGEKTSILFIISDDLTYTALSCYGNQVCQTPISTNWRPKGPASRKHTAREPIAGHHARLLHVRVLSACDRRTGL